MSRYSSPYYNSERYYDPTAGAALVGAMREEKRKRRKSGTHKQKSATLYTSPSIEAFLDWYEPNFRCEPEKLPKKRRRVAKQIRVYEYCMKHCNDPDFSAEKVMQRYKVSEKTLSQIFGKTGQITKYTDTWNRYKEMKQ